MLMFLRALVLHAVLNGSAYYTRSIHSITGSGHLNKPPTLTTTQPVQQAQGTWQSHTSTNYLGACLCQSTRDLCMQELLDNMGSIIARTHFCLCLSLQVILGEGEGTAKRQGWTATLTEPNWAACLQEFHVSVRQAYALFVATR